jgi:membrane protease YdiL (CAAX protease family)
MTSTPPPDAALPRHTGAPRQPERGPDEPPWRIWMAPAAVLLGLVVGQVAVIIVEIVGHTAGSSLTNPTPAVSIISDVVVDLAFVAAAVYFASLHQRATPADFGFRRISWRLGVAAFVIAGIAYYTVTALYANLFNIHGRERLPSELGVSRSTAALVAAAVFVCVIAPMAEEFFFRGFLFGTLRRWRVSVFGREIGTWLAAIVTGILFGLAHTGSASSQYLIPLGFLGFVLCLVRWRTRSLYPCMALHSFNNSLALGYNQLHWSAAAILGLIVGSWLVIAAITGPLSKSGRAASRPGLI